MLFICDKVAAAAATAATCAVARDDDDMSVVGVTRPAADPLFCLLT